MNENKNENERSKNKNANVNEKLRKLEQQFELSQTSSLIVLFEQINKPPPSLRATHMERPQLNIGGRRRTIISIIIFFFFSKSRSESSTRE